MTTTNMTYYPPPHQQCLNAYIVTFNCAQNPIVKGQFAAHLFDSLPHDRPAPEFLVLSLQEVAPLYYAFLGGSFVVPYLTAFKNAVDIATANRWPHTSAIEQDERSDVKYMNVVMRHCGLTALLVFVRADVADNVAWTDVAEVGVGVLDMGNKGAVGARLAYSTPGTPSADDRTLELTFVAAHIAPMENACERRNEDWRRIVERLVFTGGDRNVDISDDDDDEEEEDNEDNPTAEDTTRLLQQRQHRQSGKSSRPTQSGIFSPRSHLFFAGDLNYRTSDTAPVAADIKRFPQSDATPTDEYHHSKLLQKDQLTRELRAKRTLHGLSEAPIAFPPTYKYSDEARQAAGAASAKRQATEANEVNDEATEEEEEVSEPSNEWKWARHRWPSWCDRILYLDLPSWMSTRFESEGSSILVYAYDALPLFASSDHRPVALSVSVPLRPISIPPSHVSSHDDIRLQPPFALDSSWRVRRGSARVKEVIVGGAAYMAMTWEGNALLLATVAGIFGSWFVLRSLLQGRV